MHVTAEQDAIYDTNMTTLVISQIVSHHCLKNMFQTNGHCNKQAMSLNATTKPPAKYSALVDAKMNKPARMHF